MSDLQASDSPAPAPPVRTRSLAETPVLLDLAAQLLRTPNMLGDMRDEELRLAVGYLRLATYPAAATMFRQGDASNTGYMLLILTGEVSVEAAVFADEVDAMDISVLGPGNMIGELGLLDGGPRSTTCNAVTAVNVAVLSRKAFDMMLHEQPTVAAKLMIAMAKRLAERLRAQGDQLGIYAQIASDARSELMRVKGLHKR